jgi:hypothetical protein
LLGLSRYQFCRFAFRIIQVAENRARRQVLHIRFFFFKILRQKAFLQHELMPGKRDPFVRGEPFPWVVGLNLNELGTGTIGAGHNAIPAPDTLILINAHNPIFTLVGSSCRTDPHAFGVRAVHTEHGLIMHPGMGVFALLPDQDSGPENAFGRAIVLFASQGTGMTTSTSVEINHHAAHLTD